MAETIELCKVDVFSTSPNLCQQTTEFEHYHYTMSEKILLTV